MYDTYEKIHFDSIPQIFCILSEILLLIIQSIFLYIHNSFAKNCKIVWPIIVFQLVLNISVILASLISCAPCKDLNIEKIKYVRCTRLFVAYFYITLYIPIESQCHMLWMSDNLLEFGFMLINFVIFIIYIYIIVSSIIILFIYCCGC
jgi:hypothetical protein